MSTQPLRPGVFVHLLNVLLPLNHRWNQTDAEANFLRPSQHIVVPQNRQDAINRCRQIRKVKAAVSTRRVGAG